MKQRSPIAVFLLPFVTFGIYSIVWQVKTKNELNNLGADIPTAWLLIVPFVNLYWLWKYSEGVEKVTNGAVTAILAFVLQFLLGSIGAAILQNEFNKPVAAVGAPGSPQAAYPVAAMGAPGAPQAAYPVAAMGAPGAPQPDASFGGPIVNQAVAPGPESFSAVPTVTVPGPSDPTNAQPTQQI